MEWHRIVGYRLAADGRSVEADLDGDPTPDWHSTFGSPLDEDTEDAPRPTAVRRRLELHLGDGTDDNALVLLADYVLAANSGSVASQRTCHAA